MSSLQSAHVAAACGMWYGTVGMMGDGRREQGAVIEEGRKENEDGR